MCTEVYFVGDLLLNKKGFDWPVGTTALAAWLQEATCVAQRVLQSAAIGMEKPAQVIALSVQVFVFAGQAAKDTTDTTDTMPIRSGRAVNML